jgi:hypothetical protein
MFLREHPLEPWGFDASDPREVHLVILGFGRMGQAVALQALKYGHYPNEKRVVVTAIDRELPAREGAFRTLYPSVQETGRMTFLQMDAEDPALQPRLREWARDEGQVLTLAVCLGDDTRSLNCALALIELFEEGSPPIRVNLEQEPGIVTRGDPTGPAIQVFGRLTEMCTEDAIINTVQDNLAQAIHEDYFRRMLGQGEERGCRPSMHPWGELNEDLRDANRQQADHYATKLRTLHCYAAEGPRQTGDTQVTDFEGELAMRLDTLARTEHNRWCASRYLAGWRRGEKRDDALKIHDCLVTWDRLSDENREKDRSAVKTIKDHLVLVGLRIFRRRKA